MKRLILKALSIRKDKRFIGILIGVISIFVGWHFYKNWEKVLEYDWEFNLWFLIAAIVLSFLPFFLRGANWKFCMALLKENLPYSKSLKFRAIPQLAKYLPGGGWNYLGEVLMCESAGINKVKASTSIFLEVVLQLLAGLLLFFFTFPFY